MMVSHAIATACISGSHFKSSAPVTATCHKLTVPCHDFSVKTTTGPRPPLALYSAPDSIRNATTTKYAKTAVVSIAKASNTLCLRSSALLDWSFCPSSAYISASPESVSTAVSPIAARQRRRERWRQGRLQGQQDRHEERERQWRQDRQGRPDLEVIRAPTPARVPAKEHKFELDPFPRAAIGPEVGARLLPAGGKREIPFIKKVTPQAPTIQEQNNQRGSRLGSLYYDNITTRTTCPRRSRGCG